MYLLFLSFDKTYFYCLINFISLPLCLPIYIYIYSERERGKREVYIYFYIYIMWERECVGVAVWRYCWLSDIDMKQSSVLRFSCKLRNIPKYKFAKEIGVISFCLLFYSFYFIVLQINFYLSSLMFCFLVNSCRLCLC